MAVQVEKLTRAIMEKVGGEENVSIVTHCVTRLRFILKNVELADTEGIKALDGVLGVVIGSGQYQVILGANLFPVFEKITKEYQVETEDAVDETHTEDFQLAGSRKGVGFYVGKVTQFLSASLTPFITVLYGAGMLKVMLSLVSYFFPDAAAGNT